jgi:hypothetical protein
MSPHSRFNYLQVKVNLGAWLTWLIPQGSHSILFPCLFPKKNSIAEGARLQRNQCLDRPLGTESASTVEGQIFANSVLIQASVHDRRAFVNMVDRRCIAKSAPFLLAGASMVFRRASVLSAVNNWDCDISIRVYYPVLVLLFPPPRPSALPPSSPLTSCEKKFLFIIIYMQSTLIRIPVL